MCLMFYNRTIRYELFRWSVLGWIYHPANEHEAVCAMLVDQEKERMIHCEANLRGEWHEPHLSQGSGFCSLLVYRDCSLVLQLR